MDAEDPIKCQNCGRSVVPRLWLTGGDFLTYMTTQHLCAYCGIVMYETRGGYKRRPVIISLVLLSLALAALVAVLWYFMG